MSAAITSSNRFPEFDKYELLDEIGHGGMATVYRARDLRLDREVAVKVIHKHLRDNAEVRRRFVSEAKAVAKLRHPGIVEVYDVSDDDDEERFLVVELVRGKTLRQLLTDHGVFPAEVAAVVASTLCDAVEHAHATGVIHRDIKPENVLVELPQRSSGDGEQDDDEAQSDRSDAAGSRGGDAAADRPTPLKRESQQSSGASRACIKLTDFGIAKVLDAQGVTSTGQILGSPAHMAPEQIEGGEVGPHTDVFALGVLMYECMVGHLPFEGKNPAQVLRRVLEGDYEQADTERPVVGGRWARIVARALDKDITSRLPTAADYRTIISAELAELGIDDPRQVLNDYLCDPDNYAAHLREQLVPRLLERGERARKRGFVHGAAADFNRALAFCPGDLSILKHVTSLGSETLWRRRLGRVGAITLGAAVLAASAYGITRAAGGGSPEIETVRADDPVVAVRTAPTSARGSNVAPLRSPPVPRTTARASAAASVSSAPAVSSHASSIAPPTLAATCKRTVRFRVNPGGAIFKLDGTPTDWTSPRELDIGSSHTARVEPPLSNPNCCEARGAPFTVPPAPQDQPNKPHVVVVTIKYKPARAVLGGGPPDGVVSCSNGLQAARGRAGQRPMAAVSTVVSCSFSPGGASRQVTLRAGETVTIPWTG